MPPFSEARPDSSNSTGRFLKHTVALALRPLVVRRRRRGGRRRAGGRANLRLALRLRRLRPLRLTLPPLGRALLAAVSAASEDVVELVPAFANRAGLGLLARPTAWRLVMEIPPRLPVQMLVRVHPQWLDDRADGA